MARRADPTLDTLLALDGQVFFVDDKARLWVKFEVKRVEPSDERPHGLRYSLTLHGPGNERLVGFDNAHAAWGGKTPARDHRHRFRTIRPYGYVDAAELLADFWREVDMMMKQMGVK
ncbi:MAG: hypothetical protein BGO82_20405 [Devosia sp. 67-54]|uniref:toxin-antitoxin system TumE family protein n=1 Tax=unclassified Devosia TaxID=196773 RepID=UPI00095CA659|nr:MULTISPECIES: DUF6516 family protein [unclassified Devosia]MBN9306456.1 hypothetical protein [Devosia sp.]OJX18509.1 MAG: hypothetical protein BGO82_20405 [Devosia sp. 67-54]